MTTESPQEAHMAAELQQEHRWLQKLVGEWTMEGEAWEPGKPLVKSSGSESVRSVGDIWVLGEGQVEGHGDSPATTMITLGYDPQRERFVGTWVGSMMTQLWVYEGTLDATGRVLTLETEGPSMAGDGKLGKYRDVIEVVSDDHRVLRSQIQGADGQWHEFMTAHYHRRTS